MLPAGSRGPNAVSVLDLMGRRAPLAPYLEFNLGLSDVRLAAATAGDLLGLGDLIPDSLSQGQPGCFLLR
jgi:hypothetical protein